MSYDWSRFQLRIPISAPTEEVYKRWGTSKGLESWFLRVAQFKTNEGVAKTADEPLRPGDSYLWRWYGYRDEVAEHGVILSANHKDEISFSFGKAGNVTVRIYPVRNITMCELLQTDIPTDEQGREHYHIGCCKGWLFYLTNLKSILEGGIDLRNRDVELQDVISS